MSAESLMLATLAWVADGRPASRAPGGDPHTLALAIAEARRLGFLADHPQGGWTITLDGWRWCARHLAPAAAIIGHPSFARFFRAATGGRAAA